MKIVQVLLSPRIGGAESLAATLQEGLGELGVEVETVYLDPEGSRRGRVRRLIDLRKSLSAKRPDAVLAHSYLPGVYARLAWGLHGNVHVVLHSATDDHAGASSRLVERVLLLATASVIAVSSDQRDVYLQHFPQAKRVTLIPNGVSPAFHPKDATAHEPKRIVTVARVAHQKRPAFWARVANEVAASDPSLTLEWWGPLSQSSELDDAVQAPGSSNAAYMGPTSNVADLLVRSDILLHTAAREAHSIVLLEAALTGTPVVYPDSILPPEQHHVWRYRYRADDPGDAATLLANLKSNWAEAVQLSREYALEARGRFSAESTARRYYDWVVAHSTRPSDQSRRS